MRESSAEASVDPLVASPRDAIVSRCGGPDSVTAGVVPARRLTGTVSTLNTCEARVQSLFLPPKGGGGLGSASAYIANTRACHKGSG